MIKSINGLEPIDSQYRAIEIFEYIKEKLNEDSKYMGYKVWGNPADNENNKTFEVQVDKDILWISYITWGSASTMQENRKVILISYPTEKISIGQVLEVAFPYEYSKRFNSRLYENENIIEVRNYGKFTIGRRGLKREVFFNYLRDEGLESEILLDEYGKEYINVLIIEKEDLKSEYIKKQLIKWANIVNRFKNIQRKIYN